MSAPTAAPVAVPPRPAPPPVRVLISPGAALAIIVLGGVAVLGLWWKDTEFV